MSDVPAHGAVWGPTRMPFKAVLWDMDGTLIDSEPTHAAVLSSMLEMLGHDVKSSLSQSFTGMTEERLLTVLQQEFGLSIDFRTWSKLAFAKYLEHSDTLKARDGALALFQRLTADGIRQAVVSNADRVFLDANLRAIGLAQPGLVSVSRNDVRRGKPDPEPYLRAAWLLDIDPAEVAVVEDSPTGAAAGVAAGMTTFFWPQLSFDAPAGTVPVAHGHDLGARLLAA